MIHRTTRQVMAAAALGLSALGAYAQAEPFLGQIMCAGFDFEPRGWARADGRLLPIAQNTALFSLLGTQYGGDGRSTFALPDLRGRVMVGSGQGPSTSARSAGETGGSETQQITVNQLPSHTHVVTPLASSSDAVSISPAGKVPATKARTTLYADSTPGTHLAPSISSPAGGNQPISVMQPFNTVGCFIALQGIFPSRN